jgi:hypothetical protein
MGESVNYIKSYWQRLCNLSLIRGVSLGGVEAFFLVLMLGYALVFVLDLAPYWFNPNWTTDDSLQQVFPLHVVYHAENFAGDLVLKTMKGYLAPLHYWISYGITCLTGDPIMMAHWVSLLQVLLSLLFLFLAVRTVVGLAPAFFAVAWFLHTRPIMQRIMGGLPRGWAGVVLAGVLYAMLRRQHKLALLLLYLGCLLHPPATMLAAVAYGLYLLWGAINRSSRADFVKPLLVLILLSPLYIGTTYYVIKRPPEVGQMVDSATARSMPSFQWPNGRFPFLPLRSVSEELRFYAYVGSREKRHPIPIQMGCYFLAIVAVYFASRAIPFKLYVPNRHLQFPMSIFLITLFSIAVWKILEGDSAESSAGRGRLKNWRGALGLLALGAFVWLGTGDGLQGSANFNYVRNKKGHAFRWLRLHSDPKALVAGHPTHIDAVQLFAVRKGYATTETAHPFYPKYFAEMKRRLEISLRAHYARSLREVVELLEPEGIDYFVFSKQRFYPKALETEDYFEPLNGLVQELTARNYMDYAYKQLPREVDRGKYPFLVFRDEQSAIVNIKELREYLEQQGV